LEAPLVIPEDGAVQIQVALTAPGQDGQRDIEIHSRADSDEEEAADWIRHASGTLSADAPEESELPDFTEWPPEGAEEIETSALYESLAGAGFEYGPVFQGLTRAWSLNDAIYAEISLGEDELPTADRYSVHPALLDAALHTMFFASNGEEGVALPFAFNNVRVPISGAGQLRVRAVKTQEGGEEGSAADGAADGAPSRTSIEAFSESGEHLVSVGGVVARKADPAQFKQAASSDDALFALEWVPAASAEAPEDQPQASAAQLAVIGQLSPELSAALEGAQTFAQLADLAERSSSDEELPLAAALIECPQPESTTPDAAASELSAWALGVIKGWLEIEESAAGPLVILTRGAVAAEPGESADLALSALWGLVRSAQSEHPGRFLLIDLPEVLEASGQEEAGQEEAGQLASALASALHSLSDEPQLAIRPSGLYAPRLTGAGAAIELPEDGSSWHLATRGEGTMEGLAAIENDSASAE
ncbi:polyketide synthase dehydratase domain-containing protein, partial [Aquabacterium sp.]|uniref:polyketide synthase dehydratase domain-containing protein n=1 Tax=Aquabacterium sp. TaxID=1872578 RepID=UPI003D6CB99C